MQTYSEKMSHRGGRGHGCAGGVEHELGRIGPQADCDARCSYRHNSILHLHGQCPRCVLGYVHVHAACAPICLSIHPSSGYTRSQHRRHGQHTKQLARPSSPSPSPSSLSGAGRLFLGHAAAPARPSQPLRLRERAHGGEGPSASGPPCTSVYKYLHVTMSLCSLVLLLPAWCTYMYIIIVHAYIHICISIHRHTHTHTHTQAARLGTWPRRRRARLPAWAHRSSLSPSLAPAPAPAPALSLLHCRFPILAAPAPSWPQLPAASCRALPPATC